MHVCMYVYVRVCVCKCVCVCACVCVCCLDEQRVQCWRLSVVWFSLGLYIYRLPGWTASSMLEAVDDADNGLRALLRKVNRTKPKP
jgi:hypothetical protein